MKDWLSLNNVVVSYDGQPAVIKDCSFSIAQGEILSLLGASGCGKSTLLKAISGLLSIESGEIILDGQVIENAHINVKPQHRQVGMIFQDYALFPHLTVQQNIAFGLQTLQKKARQHLVMEALQLVRLESFANLYPHEISGGQQQRVALARALVRKPRLLLLDEPFSNLDHEVRQRVMDEMKQIFKQQQMTAIFVTHNKAEAFALADTVAVMKDGKIEQMGSPKSLYDKPNSKELASFLGGGSAIQAKPCAKGINTTLGVIPTDKMHKLAIYEEIDGHQSVFLRPHQLHLGLKDGVDVTIKSGLFLGDYSIYEVDTGHEELTVMSQKRFQIGKQVKLMLRL